jgi:hypothetical protein
MKAFLPTIHDPASIRDAVSIRDRVPIRGTPTALFSIRKHYWVARIEMRRITGHPASTCNERAAERTPIAKAGARRDKMATEFNSPRRCPGFARLTPKLAKLHSICNDI